MFGPSAHGTPSSQRRARRRIAAIAAAALVVAIIIGEIVDQVVKSGAPASTRATQTWASAVAPLLASSAALAPQLRTVRFSPTSLDRRQFDVIVGGLAAQSAALVSDYANVGLAPPRPNAAEELTSVLSLRATATARFARAADLATSGGLAASRALFAGVSSQLFAAEHALHAFRHDLGRFAAAVPSATWIDATAPWTPASLNAYAGDLAALHSLRAAPGLSIAALSLQGAIVSSISGLPVATTTTTTLPAKVTTTTLGFGATTTTLVARTTTTSTSTTTTSTPPTTTLQVPPAGSLTRLLPTTSLAVRVLVANTGNVPLGPVRLVVQLAPAPGTQSLSLGTVAAGAARYVVSKRLAVSPGARYTLIVTARAPSASASARVHLQVDS